MNLLAGQGVRMHTGMHEAVRAFVNFAVCGPAAGQNRKHLHDLGSHPGNPDVRRAQRASILCDITAWQPWFSCVFPTAAFAARATWKQVWGEKGESLMNITHSSIVVGWFLLDATNFDLRLFKTLVRALPAIATCALRGALVSRGTSVPRPTAVPQSAKTE